MLYLDPAARLDFPDMMYRLTILTGKDKNTRRVLRQEQAVLGRALSCDVVLADDDSIHDQHALIERHQTGVSIIDLESNSLQVNDQRVEQQKLESGDEVQLGDTRILYEVVREFSGKTSRRKSRLYLLALSLTGCILVAQLACILTMTLWHRREVPAKESANNSSENATDVVADVAAAKAKEVAIPKKEPAPPEEVVPQKDLGPTVEEWIQQVVDKVESGEVSGPVDLSDETLLALLKKAGPKAGRKDIVPFLGKALVAEQKGEFVEAGQWFRKSIKKAPDFYPLYIRSAGNYEKQGKLEEAFDEWGELLKMSRDVPWYQLSVNQRARIAQRRIKETRSARLALKKQVEESAAEPKSEPKPEPKSEPSPDPEPDPALPAKVERSEKKVETKAKEIKKEVEPKKEKVIKKEVAEPVVQVVEKEVEPAVAAKEKPPKKSVKTTRKKPVARKRKKKSDRLPRRVRINEISSQRMTKTEDYEEMRLITVDLQFQKSDTGLDLSDIQVKVIFYDKNRTTGSVRLSRALLPQETLSLDEEVEQGSNPSVTAAYLVPKNSAGRNAKQYRYYGCIVQVFYRGEKQDEQAQPKKLLTLFNP